MKFQKPNLHFWRTLIGQTNAQFKTNMLPTFFKVGGIILFVCFDVLHPSQHFSVLLVCWVTSTKQRIKCSAQEQNTRDKKNPCKTLHEELQPENNCCP